MKKAKNVITTKAGQAIKSPKTIQFVADDRPAVLKSLDKTVVDKTVKSLGEYELNRKIQIQPLHYQYNIEGTKYYFSTKSEGMARILIVLSQLLLIVITLLYIPTLGQVVAQLIISLLSKIVTIGQPIVIGIIILLTILWVTTFFFITIPILITRTLRTVNIWVIVTIVVGNINCLSVLAVAILQFIYVRSAIVGLNINPLVLPSIVFATFFFFTVGCVILKSDRKKYQVKVENEITNQIRALLG